MANSDDRTSDNVVDERVPDTLSGTGAIATPELAELGPVGDLATLRKIFAGDDRPAQIEALGRVLSFAPWDDIWSVIDRRQARDLLGDADLPERLRAAWQRYLEADRDDSASPG